LWSVYRARLVDEQAAQHGRGDGEEIRAILPVDTIAPAVNSGT
jgi:hypothetical protein